MEETLSDRLLATLRHAEEARNQLARGPGGREMSLAVTKIEEAVMWAERGALLASPPAEEPPTISG